MTSVTSISSSEERFLLVILDKLHISDILQSTNLLSSFQRCLSRGTQSERHNFFSYWNPSDPGTQDGHSSTAPSLVSRRMMFDIAAEKTIEQELRLSIETSGISSLPSICVASQPSSRSPTSRAPCTDLIQDNFPSYPTPSTSSRISSRVGLQSPSPLRALETTSTPTVFSENLPLVHAGFTSQASPTLNTTLPGIAIGPSTVISPETLTPVNLASERLQSTSPILATPSHLTLSGISLASRPSTSTITTPHLSIHCSPLDLFAGGSLPGSSSPQEWLISSPVELLSSTSMFTPTTTPSPLAESVSLSSVSTPAIIPSTPYSPSEPQIGPALLGAQRFFESKLGLRRHRVSYLVRATQGFLQAAELESPIHLFKNIWSAKAAIFEGGEAGSVARFRRLCEGRKRIRLGCEDYECASRLSYILLEYDIEQLLKSEVLEISCGRGRMTAALQKQAEIISESVEAVKADRKAGRAYLRLLSKGGPGSLLLVGSQVNTLWERKLSKNDIDLILDYRKIYLPEIEKKAQSLNNVAAQAIMDGLVAYGWTLGEISSVNSKLMSQLKPYLDVSEVFCDNFSSREGSHDSEIAQSAPIQQKNHCGKRFEDQAVILQRNHYSQRLPMLCNTSPDFFAIDKPCERQTSTLSNSQDNQSLIATDGLMEDVFWPGDASVDDLLHLTTPEFSASDEPYEEQLSALSDSEDSQTLIITDDPMEDVFG